jgi:hypothetical protein
MRSFVLPRRLFVSLFLVATMIFAVAASAAADSVVGTANVGAGDLRITGLQAPSVSLALDGTNKTVSSPMSITVNDATGSGAGWNLQITSTTFGTSEGKTLPEAASTITNVASVCAGQGLCTDPINGVGYVLAVPAGATAPSPVKLFNAAADTGMGVFDITPTFEVSVPANAYAGNYTSEIFITVSSGP